MPLNVSSSEQKTVWLECVYECQFWQRVGWLVGQPAGLLFLGRGREGVLCPCNFVSL